jgi:PAS domain S-box-containing protein
MAAKRSRGRSPKKPDWKRPEPKCAPWPKDPAPRRSEIDPVSDPPERSGPPVAAVCASAGGLDVFRTLLAAMPVDAGLALVLVVPPAEPQSRSPVAELLSNSTAMPVVEAMDGMAVRANRVYVLPSGGRMAIDGGVLRSTEPHGPQSPVDLFLQSLADDRKEKAIGIVLDGNGSPGGQGLRAIRAAGGLAVVVDSGAADCAEAPSVNNHPGVADQVLPVEQVPAVVKKYVRHVNADGDPPGKRAGKSDVHLSQAELSTVIGQLEEMVHALEAANYDVTNLLNCIDIPMLFLDSGCRVRQFTPAATWLLGVTAAAELMADTEELLRDLVTRERELHCEDGRWYVRRILPHRTQDGRIDGVVVTFVDVTERKSTADAVTRRLAAIVESSADAIFSKDLDGTIRTWNHGAERLYGYTPSEVFGRSVRMLVPPDRTDEWIAIMDRVRCGEPVERVETERLSKEGRRVFVSLTLSPIRDGDGKVVSLSTVARDISERKRAEELQRLQAEVAAHLVEGVNLVRERDAVFVYTNRRFEELYGYKPGEMLGKPVAMVNTPDERSPEEIANQLISELRRTGRWTGELRNVRKDGTVFWTFASVTAFTHAEYGPVWLGVQTDITERKKAEQALRDREERLRAILTTAADAIVTIDRQGVIQSVNPATERLFGYDADELVGQSVNLLMPSPYKDEHEGYLATYLRTGVKHVIGTGREGLARRKDGTLFPVDLTISEVEPLKLFTGIIRDITRRKELEREVVEIASLEQRRIGQDLHDSVAQELTAINLLAGDLTESLKANRPDCQDLAVLIARGLQNSQQALRAVMRGLLPVSVDSQGLMAALADLAERTRQVGKTTCTFDCPEPVHVADNLTATHLYLIAQEAVHNVVKHAQAGEIRIGLRSDRELYLSVEDDGVGMPVKPSESEGLGLRIMRNRAAIIGATLTISRGEPHGTLVRCVLPRSRHEAG